MNVHDAPLEVRGIDGQLNLARVGSILWRQSGV